MQKTYIYILVDPRDNQPKYVGKSINPRSRLYQHTYKFHHTLCGNWLKSLSRQGLKPLMEIIDESDDGNWGWLEQYWIEQFKAWGFPLKNIALGGFDLPPGYISAIHKGRVMTEEHRRKISNTLRGTKHTEERKEKIGRSTAAALKSRNRERLGRELHQLDKVAHTLIHTYNSVKEAHEVTGISRSAIGNCLIARANSAGGYVWKWVSIK